MKEYKYYFQHVVVPTLVYGNFAGVAVGIVVYFFKIGAEFLTEKSVEIYEWTAAHPAFLPLLFAGLIALAALMHLVHRYVAETKGCGIPRAEGVVRGILTFRWLKTGVATVLSSYMTFIAGLPLDSEGPSVLLGTALGDGVSRLPLSHDSWRKYIMTGGASAAFAVATTAPLSGILFALEEIHKRFTPMILLMASSSVLFATGTSYLLGMALGRAPAPLFAFASFGAFGMSDIWIVLILGCVVGPLACLFNLLTDKLSKIRIGKNHRLSSFLHLAVVFVLVGVIGLFLPDILGGGGELIVKISRAEEYTLVSLILLFVVKFVLVCLCAGSGATGGISISMMCVGALIGAVCGKIFLAAGMSETLYPTVVIICLAAFMGASTHAPLTAMVFAVESTWQFQNLFYVGVAVLLSYLITQLMKAEPLYDVLLEPMAHEQNRGKTMTMKKFLYVVQEGTFAVNKSVRDILWPANTKVRSIVAANNADQSDNDGDRRIHAGDSIMLQSHTYDEQTTKAELDQILGKQENSPDKDG